MHPHVSQHVSLLALHGFTGCGEDFSKFSPFCGPGIAWHCPNLPGHGPAPDLSCGPEATIARVHDAQRALPKRAHTHARVLLGYSMGARAALLHATTFPDAWDALILISANPGIESEAERTERRQSDARLAQQIETAGLRSFLECWQQHPLIRSQQNIPADWQPAMRAHRLQHSEAGLAASLRQFGQGQCPNLWPMLSKITSPVLLITGGHDEKYTKIGQRMARELATCNHAVVTGAGHMPHLEAPVDSSGYIRDFLNLLDRR